MRWSVFRYLTKDLRLSDVPKSAWKPICKSHFKQQREMLDVRGYTVFEGFVTRDSVDVGRESTAW